MRQQELPIAVIGAGPIGLATAAHLLAAGETPLVFEAGDNIAANIRQWAHVPLFSPWHECLDPVSADMLRGNGWTPPDPDAMPHGRDVVADYLEPLSRLPAMAACVRLRRRVTSIRRQDPGNTQARFVLHVQDGEGGDADVPARAVIDASGTWMTPNQLGRRGLPVTGEAELRDRVHYGIPDILGRDRARYAGRRALVVGAGHSAANCLLMLSELALDAPRTEIVWAIRGSRARQIMDDRSDDPLSARARLGRDVADLLRDKRIDLFSQFQASALRRDGDRVEVVGHSDGTMPASLVVDQVICATGQRPDPTLAQALRLDLDPVLDCPAGLAPLIDPERHTCNTVAAHGAAELRHPEPDFYTVGMKSYGRAPTFLMRTGYMQVRSVVAAITAAHRQQPAA